MSTSASDISLTQLRDTLISIALEAGERITSATPSTTSSLTKKNTADLVTETDRAVENFISTKLKSLYPTFSFLGEETYQPGQKLGPEPTFVVDPIDGTTNFVHRWGYVSVSLGVAIDRIPVVGVVYNPFQGKLYHGVKGQGSYLRDLTVKVGGASAGAGASAEPVEQKLPLKPLEPIEALDGALIAIEWGSDRSGANWKTKTDTWDNLGRAKDEGGAMVHSARALGSAALNLCAVAEGSIDAYWEGGCWAWDVCAGWVVLAEAGGVIVDGNPGTWDIPVDHRKYLAVKGGTSGQKEFIEEFWSHVKGTMTYDH